MFERNNLDSLLYLASNAAVALMPLLLLPVLTEHLSQAEYGRLGIFLVVVSLFGALTGAGVSSSILSNYYKMNDAEVGSYITSSIAFLVLSFFASLIFFNLLSSIICEYIDLGVKYFYYAILISTLNSINLIRLVLYQVKGKSKSYFLFQVINASVTAIMVYYFVVLDDNGLDGRIEAQALALIFMASFGLTSIIFEVRKNISFSYSFFEDLLKFCFPLVPHYIAGFFLMGIDRIIIGRLTGSHNVGVYTIAAQITQSIALIADAINKSYQPKLFVILNGNDVHGANKCILMMALNVIFISMVLLTVVFFTFDYVIGDKFYDAKNYILILFFSQIFHAMYLFKNNVILNKKKTYLSSIATTTTGVTCVALTYFLTLNFGVSGAAYAQVLTMLFLWVITWFFGRMLLGLSLKPKFFRGSK